MGFLASLFSQAGVGWLVRRAFDWGGWLLAILGGILAFFTQLDPQLQMMLLMALQGNWQSITIGSLFGIVPLAISQWRSWKATVDPHIVTSDTRKVVRVPVMTEEQARDATGYQGPIQDRSK